MFFMGHKGTNRKSANASLREMLSHIDLAGQFLYHSWQLNCQQDTEYFYPVAASALKFYLDSLVICREQF